MHGWQPAGTSLVSVVSLFFSFLVGLWLVWALVESLSLVHAGDFQRRLSLSFSAAVSTEETATFMLLPSWNKNMTTNSYASLCRKYPHMCKFLGTIPSDQLQCARVPFWNNIQVPLSKHSWELQIIAKWNTKCKNRTEQRRESAIIYPRFAKARI